LAKTLTDAEVALPKPTTIVVGGGEDKKEYVILPFKMGKTLIVLERISRLLEEQAVADVLTNGNLQGVFLSKLPQLLATARPKLFELFGLILLSNRDVVQLNESNKLDERLLEIKRELELTADTDDAFKILEAGIDAIGLESIQGKVLSLREKFTKKAE